MKLRQQYRIYPNKQQEQQMISVGGSTRFVFNYFLKRNMNQYAIDKKFVWYNDMANELVDLKKEKDWLSETYSQVLQQAARDLDMALHNMKRGLGFPHFKSKYYTPISFRYQQNVKVIGNQLKLPKIGNVKIVLHRALPIKFAGVTITRDNIGNWYASFVCERQEKPLVDKITTRIGVDVNSKYTALSNGELIENPRPLKEKKNQIKKLQRRLSRQEKGSNRYKKTKYRLAKMHKWLANIRMDHNHKLSSRIAKDYDLVSIETLKIEEMKRKSKPVAKAIADTGWAIFLLMLAYKCPLQGHHLIKTNQWLPSSKGCHNCGNKQDIPLNIRWYDCPNCGISIHRDINAASNIDNFGFYQWSYDNKPGQELPKVPVDSFLEILASDGITSTDMKREACVL